MAVLILLAAGIAQYFLTRSRMSLQVKWLPTLLVGGVALVCSLASFNVISLPHTHWFDQGSWFALPDFVYVAVYTLIALAGVALGAFIGWISPKNP